jgi:hypothetical protein
MQRLGDPTAKIVSGVAAQENILYLARKARLKKMSAADFF